MTPTRFNKKGISLADIGIIFTVVLLVILVVYVGIYATTKAELRENTFTSIAEGVEGPALMTALLNERVDTTTTIADLLRTKDGNTEQAIIQHYSTKNKLFEWEVLADNERIASSHDDPITDSTITRSLQQEDGTLMTIALRYRS